MKNYCKSFLKKYRVTFENIGGRHVAGDVSVLGDEVLGLDVYLVFHPDLSGTVLSLIRLEEKELSQGCISAVLWYDIIDSQKRLL